MKRRLLSLGLLAALVLGMLCPASAVDEAESETSQVLREIVYIPLDDRPLSKDRVELMAEMLNVKLIMPDMDLYATRLDGQITNSNGTQYGDRGALMAWLMEQAEQYDTFILSMDQLLSGGLMNSRCMSAMEKLVLPDGTEMTEYEVVDYIAELSETKQVYVIDSVMRLALSAGYGGFGLEAYSLTRNYGKQPRTVLTGDQLTLDNVIAGYRQCLSTQTSAETVTEDVTPEGEVVSAFGMAAALQAERRTGLAAAMSEDEIIDQYLSIRERKLRLLDYAVRKLSNMPNIAYILGVDDSFTGNNIHTNEFAYIEKIAGENLSMFSALDGLAQMVLGRIYDDWFGNREVRLNVTYYGTAADMIPEFNYQPVSELISSTAEYLGAEITTGKGDISLIVVACGSGQNTENFTQVVDQINQNELSQIPTILADFTDYNSTTLQSMLIESVHVGNLLSYSGYNDGAVRISIALAEGISRYRGLFQSLLESSHIAQAESIASAMVREQYKTGGTQGTVASELNAQGVDCSNFGTDNTSLLENYREILDNAMKSDTKALMENVARSNVIVSLEPYTVQGISTAVLDNCRFPWNRTFEIGFELDCTLSEESYSYTYHPAFVQGVGGGRFAPLDSLSRNQAAKMLVIASENEEGSPMDCPFEDVHGWPAGFVATACAKGYMRGYADGSFRGTNPITRAEFAKMLMQYLEAEGVTLEPVTVASFTDVAEDAWYAEAVYMLANGGVIKGYGNGSFKPGNRVTRTEAVVMLGRLFQRNDDPPQWILNYQKYTDVSSTFWGYQAIAEASFGHFAS